MDLLAELVTTDCGTPRRGARTPVSFGAALRKQGMTRFPVSLIDLSTHGFCTELFDPLLTGSYVWLTLPGLAPLHARVAWCEGFRVGCEFQVPLHPSVLQSIVDRESAGRG